MGIPSTTDMYGIVLGLFSDGRERTRKEAKRAVRDVVGLSDEDCALRTSTGASVYGTRVGWGISNLARAGLLDRVRRGVYAISGVGRDVLARGLSPSELGLLVRRRASGESSRAGGAAAAGAAGAVGTDGTVRENDAAGATRAAGMAGIVDMTGATSATDPAGDGMVVTAEMTNAAGLAEAAGAGAAGMVRTTGAGGSAGTIGLAGGVRADRTAGAEVPGAADATRGGVAGEGTACVGTAIGRASGEGAASCGTARGGVTLGGVAGGVAGGGVAGGDAAACGEPDSSSAQHELSPRERIDSLAAQMDDVLGDEFLEAILEQDPDFFERLVVDLLVKMGYGEGVVTKRSGDGGIDGVISDELDLHPIHVQAKRYGPGNAVGRELVQKFAGALLGCATAFS